MESTCVKTCWMRGSKRAEALLITQSQEKLHFKLLPQQTVKSNSLKSQIHSLYLPLYLWNLSCPFLTVCRSKKGLEIFPAAGWSTTYGLIAIPNKICLLGINIAVENISGLEDKRNCCQIMISEVFPVVREKSWTKNVWSFGFHSVIQRGIIGVLETYLKCICEYTGV